MISSDERELLVNVGYEQTILYIRKGLDIVSRFTTQTRFQPRRAFAAIREH